MTDANELDSLLAIDVMGWSIIDEQVCLLLPGSKPPGLYITQPIYNWQPTKYVEQALRCARKYCISRMLIMEIMFYPEGNDYTVTLTGCNGREACRTNGKLELAICEAIKESIEGE